MRFTHQPKLMQDLSTSTHSLAQLTQLLCEYMLIFDVCAVRRTKVSPRTADAENCYINEAVNFSPPGFCVINFGGVWKAERRTIPAENVFYFFIPKTRLISTDCFSSLSPNYSLSISITSNYSTTPPLPTSPLRHPDQHIF